MSTATKQVTVVILLWCVGLFTFNYRFIENWLRKTPIHSQNKITHKLIAKESTKLCQPQPLSNQSLSSFNKSGFWQYHNSQNCSSISCNYDSYNFSSLSCANATHKQLNCIGSPTFDPILKTHVTYRKNDCIYKTFSGEDMISCFSKHKSIAIIGDSTSWQQWKVAHFAIKRLYKRLNRRQRKKIKFQNRWKYQITSWNDTRNTSKHFKFQFVGRGPKRTPTLTFLSESYLSEFAKYWTYFHQNNENQELLKGEAEFITEIHKTGKKRFIDILNTDKVETIIFNDNIHAVSFWQFYNFFIQDKMYNDIRLSFNWTQSRRQIYETAINFFFQNVKYLKRLYFWSGYKPPPSCHKYLDQWDEFNDYAIDVVNGMNMDNIYYIDTADVGRSYTKGANDRRYTDGKCHYTGIMIETGFNALLNELCPNM